MHSIVTGDELDRVCLHDDLLMTRDDDLMTRDDDLMIHDDDLMNDEHPCAACSSSSMTPSLSLAFAVVCVSSRAMTPHQPQQ